MVLPKQTKSIKKEIFRNEKYQHSHNKRSVNSPTLSIFLRSFPNSKSKFFTKISFAITT